MSPIVNPISTSALFPLPAILNLGRYVVTHLHWIPLFEWYNARIVSRLIESMLQWHWTMCLTILAKWFNNVHNWEGASDHLKEKDSLYFWQLITFASHLRLQNLKMTLYITWQFIAIANQMIQSPIHSNGQNYTWIWTWSGEILVFLRTTGYRLIFFVFPLLNWRTSVNSSAWMVIFSWSLEYEPIVSQI